MAKKDKEIKKSKEVIDSEIADAIMELPYPFYVGDKRFFIYPMTLGKTFLIERAMSKMEINKMLLVKNPYMEALRLCHEYKQDVSMVISYHTFKTKDELMDTEEISARADIFAKEINEEDLASLFLVVTAPDKYDEFAKHLGIEEERKWQKRAMKVKSDSDSITFGGKSIYGSFIDFACERYGWTYEYVIWGISYINLQLLMADTINTIYLSKEERKKIHIPKDRSRISGDDPKNKELLKQLLS